MFEFIEDPHGVPVGVKSVMTVSMPPERVVERITALQGRFDFSPFLTEIPMVRNLQVAGDSVRIDLQFKVAFLSVKFGCRAKIVREKSNVLRVEYVDGEPAGLWLRFSLLPGEAEQSRVQVESGFDLDSLGWVAKYFLKHHPEIRPGVFAGVGYAITDVIRRVCVAEQRDSIQA